MFVYIFPIFIWYLFRKFLGKRGKLNNLFCIFLAYTIDISKLSSPVTPFSVSQGFFHSVPRPKANLILLFIKQLGPSNRRLSTITTSNWTPLAQGLTLGNSSLPCPGPRAVLFITLLNICHSCVLSWKVIQCYPR